MAQRQRRRRSSPRRRSARTLASREHRSVRAPSAASAQKVYPNMLFGALLRGPFLYVPNVGAQPEPPVNFNTNVQALVGVLSSVDRTPRRRSR